MLRFLALQSTYHTVECAFFHDAVLIETVCLDKTVASSMLIPTLNSLLVKHNTLVTQLNFIAVNSGPAPFTSLRVVITTVNGVHYAQAIPLVSVNGFDALWHEWDDCNTTTAIVLNAFNNDVYCAFKKAGDTEYVSGYGNIEAVARFLACQEQGTVRLLGNGVALYHTILQQCLGNRMYVPTPCPQMSSLSHVGLVGLMHWSRGYESQYPIQPLYLKGSPDTLHIT